jgi:hypothetical protein
MGPSETRKPQQHYRLFQARIFDIGSPVFPFHLFQRRGTGLAPKTRLISIDREGVL